MEAGQRQLEELREPELGRARVPARAQELQAWDLSLGCWRQAREQQREAAWPGFPGFSHGQPHVPW